MQYTMTLYVADRARNALMKAADMCPDYKVFIEKRTIPIKTTSNVDEAYIYRLIELSKTQPELEGSWIPAIEFCGVLYVDESIKEISDGTHVGFVNRETVIA